MVPGESGRRATAAAPHAPWPRGDRFDQFPGVNNHG